MYDKPYFILQRLKLRLLREEHKQRPAPYTEAALALAAELWQLEDSSRFVLADAPDAPWSFKGG